MAADVTVQRTWSQWRDIYQAAQASGDEYTKSIALANIDALEIWDDGADNGSLGDIDASAPNGRGDPPKSLGDEDLSKMDEATLMAKFENGPWDEASLGKFKAEFERRAKESGGELTTAEQATIDKAIEAAKNGELDSAMVKDVRMTFGTSTGNTDPKSLGDQDLTKLDNDQLMNKFEDGPWDEASLAKFKAEFERRAKESGGKLMTEEQTAIDKAIEAAKKGELTQTLSDDVQKTFVDDGSSKPKSIGKEDLTFLKNDELIAKFKDGPWDEESLNAFKADFERRAGKGDGTLTEKEQETIDKAIEAGKKGDVDKTLADDLKKTFGPDGSKTPKSLGKEDLSSMSNDQLMTKFRDGPWDEESLNAFKAEFERRAGKGEGTLTAEEQETIDKAIEAGKKGDLETSLENDLKKTFGPDGSQQRKPLNGLNLSALSNEELIAKLKDGHWDAQALNYFQDELEKRAGRDNRTMTTGEKDVIAKAIESARKGTVDADLADAAGRTLDARDKLDGKKLGDLDEKPLSELFASKEWDDASIEMLKKEYERRAMEDGVIGAQERQAIDAAVTKAKAGQLSKKDAAELWAKTSHSEDLLRNLSEHRGTLSQEQIDAALAELERRAANDSAGLQPREREILDKLKNGPITDAELNILKMSLPDNADDRKSWKERWYETKKLSELSGTARGENLSESTLDVEKAILREELRDRASKDGGLTNEEAAAIDAYINAIGPGKDATKEWAKVVELLPEAAPVK